MTTVDIISKLLAERGISASKMMSALGFSNGLFSQWKSRKQKPSREKLDKIADYFGVSVDYLLGKEETAARPVSDDDIKFALYGTTDISEDDYEEVKKLAEIQKKLRNK